MFAVDRVPFSYSPSAVDFLRKRPPATSKTSVTSARTVRVLRMNRSISVPDGLDAKVEEARGDVPRSVFWVRAMERALGGSEPAGRQTPVRTDPAPSRSSKADPEVCAACGARPNGLGRRVHQPGCALGPNPKPPKAERRQKASDAVSAALARQRALNKSKGI